MKKQLEDIEEYREQNERRKFYKAVEKVKSGYQPRMEGCLNKEGNVLQERNKVLESWEEDFKELLNTEDKEERVTTEGKDRSREEEREETNIVESPHTIKPTKHEVVKCIQKFKNNKAPGEDNISAELVKHGGEIMTAQTYMYNVGNGKNATRMEHGHPMPNI